MFKLGDLVECIKPMTDWEYPARVGQHYIVTKLHDMGHIQLNYGRGWYVPGKFRLVRHGEHKKKSVKNKPYLEVDL